MFIPLLFCTEADLDRQMRLMHEYFEQTKPHDVAALSSQHASTIAQHPAPAQEQLEHSESDSYEHCGSEAESYEEVSHDGADCH